MFTSHQKEREGGVDQPEREGLGDTLLYGRGFKHTLVDIFQDQYSNIRADQVSITDLINSHH